MQSTSKRRRFQAPITSFFSPAVQDGSETSTGLELSGLQKNLSYSYQPLPATIQSSLLTVGMRIRKSIPEGYKTTEKKLSQLVGSYYLDSGVNAYEQKQQSTGHGYSELAPYCSLHHVGGLAVQPMPAPTALNHSGTARQQRADEEVDQTWFPSSQDSSYSNNPMMGLRPQPPSSKRPFLDFDDEGDEVDDWDQRGEIWPDTTTTSQHQLPPNFFPSLPTSGNGGSVSTLSHIHHQRESSYPISHTRMPNLSTLLQSSPPSSSSSCSKRPLATPRSRLKPPSTTNANLASQRREYSSSSKHDNTAATTSFSFGMDVTEDNDFEDAAFLRRKEELDDAVMCDDAFS